MCSLAQSVRREAKKKSARKKWRFSPRHARRSKRNRDNTKPYENTRAALFVSVFAIQNGGACLSGPTAGRRFNQFGESSSCKAGKGSLFANDVYRLTDSGEHK